MTRRLNYWLIALIAIISVPYYWYLIADPASAGAAPKAVTIGQLRQLADALPGQRPVQVRSEILGSARIMRNRLIAGWGLRPAPLAVRSFQLVMPGNQSIVIGAGVSAATAEKFDMRDYRAAPQNRVEAAMRQAAHTVMLNGGPLQRGDLPASPRNTAPAKADAAPYPLAPGVVVIPVPGIEPAAKLVYVRLANGREFLFAGAAAKVHESLTTLVPPARISQRADLPNSGTETKSWLMTINALRHAAPDMAVVSAHEPAGIPHVVKGFIDNSKQD